MIKRLLSVVVVLASLAIVANVFIRVGSSSGTSHGIVEEWLFGRSATSAATRMIRSEAFVQWDDANELSARVAERVAEHGPRLASDPRLTSDRIRTARLARTAFDSAAAVPADYLANSHAELPRHYREHFVESMRLFAEGLESSDAARVRQAMEQYNQFLEWIQSRDRNEFKRLK